MKPNFVFLFFLLLFTFSFFTNARANSGPFRADQKISLPGEDGWDYLTLDTNARRLYVTRHSHVSIYDADTWKPVGEIGDTKGVHGVAIAPDLHRGFTSNGGAGTLTIFDLHTFKKVGEVKAGENPDSILYDPFSKNVFAFNGKSHDATVVDAAKGTVLATIPLNGKPEFSATNAQGTIFVNIEDKHELVAIDSKTFQILRRSILPCESPSGLTIDAEHHRLFSVCDEKIMTVTDSETGKPVTTVTIGEGPDAVIFDAKDQLIVSSNGADGTITVVHEKKPNSYEVVQTLPTQKGARTLAFDEKTGKIALVTASFGPPLPVTPQNPHGRPAILPRSVVAIILKK